MKIIYIAACLVLISVNPVFAESDHVGGHEGGNGGDEIALEFTNAYGNALDEIQRNQPGLAARLGVAAPALLPQLAHIYVQDENLPVQIPGGLKQDSVAVNEPATRSIWINRARWKKVFSPRVREAIALHEILSLEGVEGTGRYPISSAYLAKFRLRNDALVIITGQDPAMPSWKTKRTSCEDHYFWYDASTKKYVPKNVSSLRADLYWQVGDVYFNLRYYLGNENESDAEQVTASFLQTTARVAWVRGNLSLMQQLSSRALGRAGKKTLESSDYNSDRYLLSEVLDGGKSVLWTWENGQKGRPTYSSVETELADGSLRTLSEDLSVKSKGDAYTQDCVTKNVPGEEWLALVADPAMGIEIEKLNSLAMLYYDADRVAQTCESAGCSVAKQNRDQALAKFSVAWNEIYVHRAARMGIKIRTKPKRSR